MYPGKMLGLVMTAILTIQWQLVAQIDDVMNPAKSTLQCNYPFPYALNVHMVRLKNFNEEREAPLQILFGLLDPLICPLLNFSTFLESEYQEGPKLFGSCSNKSVSNILIKIFQSSFFANKELPVRLLEGKEAPGRYLHRHQLGVSPCSCRRCSLSPPRTLQVCNQRREDDHE